MLKVDSDTTPSPLPALQWKIGGGAESLRNLIYSTSGKELREREVPFSSDSVVWSFPTGEDPANKAGAGEECWGAEIDKTAKLPGSNQD